MDHFCKFFTVFFIGLVFLSHPSFASCSLYSEEKAEKIITEADFIGLAKISERSENKQGYANSLTLAPVFTYKKSETFPPDQKIQIFFNEEIMSSCDYLRRSTSDVGMFEVIIYQEGDGSFRLGNKSDMGLRDHWQTLRKNVEYIK